VPDLLRDPVRDQLQTTLGASDGGTSRVFVATETSLGRRRVVEVLAPELRAGVNTERRHREIRLAAQLRHPHVAPLLSAAERAGLLYYTTPFVEGEPLRTRVDHVGELPVAEALRVLRDIADASPTRIGKSSRVATWGW
jgi:serine/threonine-protein kinase